MKIFQIFVVLCLVSDIPKSFSVGKTTCAYYINFSFLSYFKDLLLDELKSSKYIVLSYDESLNTILEEDQIDTLVTFFIETTELVEIRYFDSTFSNVSIVLIVYRSLSNLSHLCFIQMYCSCQWMILMSIQMS